MTFQISKEALGRYLQRREQDIDILKNALQSNDYSQIQHIAHQIKGNAATFGFAELGEHAKSLESLAINKDSEALSNEISWFEKWVASHPNN